MEVNRKQKSTVREYAEVIGMALFLALFIRTFIVQAFKIPSGSMIPTLQIGDHILVNKMQYGIRIPFWGEYIWEYKKPKRGDVVVFIFPKDHSKDFIKRVIGVGGDLVEVRNGKVYINNVVINDPHAYFETAESPANGYQMNGDYGPKRVPKDHIFVMGDNRNKSYDSRYWGYVDLQAVKGKAFIVYWSWDWQDHWARWGRIGHVIH